MPIKDIFLGKKRDIYTIISVIADTLNIDIDRTEYIIPYVVTIKKDYKNNIIEAIKEIPLNLKKNEKYFAQYILGNLNANMFEKMSIEEGTKFLDDICKKMDISEEKCGEITEFLTDEVVVKIEDTEFENIIKNMINSNFSEKEKDYMFFTFGVTI